MKYIFSLIFLFFSVIGLGQCEIYIVPGSSQVIDHDPGISFIFEVQNNSDTPYFGGDLYLDWSLSGGSSGPIWDFDFGVFPILPGESKYVSTPSFDIPLPENVPGNWSPYSGWSGDEYVEYFRITLDENANFNDSDCYQWMLDGDGGYWNEPLSDGCNNPNGDNFCDDQCNLEVLDFNLETAELTIIPNSTYCPNLGSPFWQSQFPFDNPYVFGFQLNFNWGSNQIDISVGNQNIYQSSDIITLDLSTLLNNLAYQNMVESINEGEFCDLTFTLFNINNTGGQIWQAPDNQTIELINLCPVVDEYVDVSLDTILYDIGCEWVFGSPDPVPYWNGTFYLTNNGDFPITELCIVEDIIGTLEGDDTLCFNNLNIIPGETYEITIPFMYEWGVLSVRVINVNGENGGSDFGWENPFTVGDNMYVQIINYNDECEPIEIPGCTIEQACNYNPNATLNDNSCDFESCAGCMDPEASNYDPEATIDTPGLCEYEILGCTDINAINYNPLANTDDGSCIDPIVGCMIPEALNYDPIANVQCLPIMGGCCIFEEGCMDEEALNYNPDAWFDDGSCEYDIFGCTNPFASNYNSLATIDDGSCILILAGCTDPEAINYNPNAGEDDGSCVYDDNCNGIFAPNTFTPNNDGVNDIWTLVTDPSCWIDWHILIYDRWGRLVWESTTPGEVWVGSNYKGNHYVADGIYVYTAKGVGYNPNNTFQKSGYITIFR
jgi:gliding motility-associated-like protein